MQYNSAAYFETLKEIIIQYLSKNYDYCYLSAMHEKNRRDGAETIIVGSSHSMNGLLERRMEEGGWGRTINFSISSQDIWFDYMHIKKAVREGKSKIRFCIINFGYYMFYQDLSKSTVMGFLLPKVYAPLFGKDKMHHRTVDDIPNPLDQMIYDRDFFPDKVVLPVCEHWAKSVLYEQSSYYGDLIQRESTLSDKLKKNGWIECNAFEKREIAEKRAADHNKLKKHLLSREENETLMHDMIGFLIREKIRPVILITPFSKEYNEFINPAYKTEIVQLLDKLPYPVEFLDLNDYADEFVDTDFMDSDHLSLAGAEKTTLLLNQYLQIIQEDAERGAAEEAGTI